MRNEESFERGSAEGYALASVDDKGVIVQTDYLRYFVDVARLGSITLAAERHFMSPQGVSRAVAALEKSVGGKLFVRSHNSVSLTRTGMEFLSYASRMIEVEDEAAEHLATLDDDYEIMQKKRFVGYCCPVAFDTPLFYPLADSANSLFPRVHFFQQNTDEVVGSLLRAALEGDENTVAFGLLCLYDVFADRNEERVAQLLEAGYVYRPILQSYDMALVSDRSPLAKKKALSKADVASLPIVVTSDLYDVAAHVFGDDGIYVAASDRLFRMHLAMNGEGITFVPGFTLAYQVEKGVVVVPLQEPWMLEVGFVATRDVMEGPLIADICRAISSTYRGKGDSSIVRLVG